MGQWRTCSARLARHYGRLRGTRGLPALPLGPLPTCTCTVAGVRVPPFSDAQRSWPCASTTLVCRLLYGSAWAFASLLIAVVVFVSAAGGYAGFAAGLAPMLIAALERLGRAFGFVTIQWRKNGAASCGRLASFVELEQRDPSMGQAARLDMVEYASAEGTAAAYDVSVVTSLRADRRFVARCAATPGYAAAARVRHKLHTQYAGRVPGARLVPLVVEAGGRWHPDAELLLRQLARAYVRRTAGLDNGALGAVVARWSARLSAVLIRGGAAVLRRAGFVGPPVPRGVLPHAGSWQHPLPEGESAYDLLVG